MSEKKDTCAICCEWVSSCEGKSPRHVCDTYPKMMRKVLKAEFGMPKKAAEHFIEYACYGNWTRLHLTDAERQLKAKDYAELLIGDVWYCSDRWSWDRVLRIQWLYMRLRDTCRRDEGE